MRKWKLYPVTGDRRYYLVYVFRTRAMMLYHRQRLEAAHRCFVSHIEALGDDYDGCASWWSNWTGSQMASFGDALCVGVVMIHLAQSGVRVVSHELQHAAMYWTWYLYNGKHYDMRGKDGGFGSYDWHEIEHIKASEEAFCYLVGDINARYWRGWFRHCEKWAEQAKPWD